MPRFRFLSLAALAATLCFASPAAAAASPADRCTLRKLEAAGRAALAHVACHARALRQGTAVRPRCHADADRRFEAAFARLEARGGCAFVGDAAAVDAGIDALLDALTTGALPGGCTAAKLRAAGRMLLADFGCERTALRQGPAAGDACRARAAVRLARDFGHAERRHACDVIGDAPAMQATLEAFVAATGARLVNGPPDTPPAPTDLSATITGADVVLAWTPPDPASGNTHVRLLRRLNAAPVGPDDPAATVVAFGTAAGADDPVAGLLPSVAGTTRVYHYAAFGCTAGGACETTGTRTTITPTLVQALRAGGYVIHWRHSAADVCSDNLGLGTAATTMTPGWWKSCDANCGTATARQLNATGVMEATSIGQFFDARGITVGRVLSSEYCRNVGTAAYMDFGPPIEERQDITYFVYDEAGRCDASYALFAEAPAAGTNTAVIGHAGFGTTCPVLSSLAWSEAAIFKPDGAGGSTFVTRVTVGAWAGLP